jgi:glycosyltransferase involved in cell wall biosynthesis
MKTIILQRVIPSYRVTVFTEITAYPGHDIKIIIGDDLFESKAKNAKDLSNIRHIKLPARAISLFGRVFTRHCGLLSRIIREKPDVIVCEAESHFLGYLTAIFYKIFVAPRTRLILWCFYALPGLDKERTFFHAAVKSISRQFFHGFISYSTYGKAYLVSKGVVESKITVAINVCDTNVFFDRDQLLQLNKIEAKKILNVENMFVASYVGTLDKVKNPEFIIELGKIFRDQKFHFFLVGTGTAESELKEQIKNEDIANVSLTGRVTENLPLYYRASDVILVPGRGGIVMSEAMCFGVPVIVHQADGTEYDLVFSGKTGIILQGGQIKNFADELRRLSCDPVGVENMGRFARKLIQEQCNTNMMANSVIRAIEGAMH